MDVAGKGAAQNLNKLQKILQRSNTTTVRADGWAGGGFTVRLENEN